MAHQSAIRIPPDAPWFDGHFPGRPLLPAVVQLDIVLRELAAWRGASPLAWALRSVRFRRPVTPGTELQVHLEQPAEDRIGFALRRDGDAVCDGSLILAPPRIERGATEHPGSRADELDLDLLLPHRGSMMLVREVLARGEDEVLCLAVLPSDCPYLEEGSAPALVALEIGAQAAAVLHAGGRTTGEGPPPAGVLAGIRTAEALAPRLPADRPIEARARRIGDAPPLAMVEVDVAADGRRVVSGTLSLLRDR